MTWCIPASSSPPERPGLVLLLDSPEKESLAAMIGTGCEEEGIPIVWDFVPSCEGHPAHAASMRSRLDIGIAVKGETASIGVSNLPGRAWIEMDVHDDRLWRWLGQAAARMVKGQPLPPPPRDEKLFVEEERSFASTSGERFTAAGRRSSADGRAVHGGTKWAVQRKHRRRYRREGAFYPGRRAEGFGVNQRKR